MKFEATFSEHGRVMTRTFSKVACLCYEACERDFEGE